MENEQQTEQKNHLWKYVVAIIILLIIAGGIYFYFFRKIEPHQNMITTSTASTTFSFSLPGYIVFVSPQYNFLVLSSTSTPIKGTLPSLDGFPPRTDPNYKYISYADYKGTVPAVGDKVLIDGTVNKAVTSNPPLTFPATAQKITVLSQTDFNSTVTNMVKPSASTTPKLR
jgi:hypothetical protein